MNILKHIEKWFEKAVPQPTAEKQMIQIGCHFEEIKEMCHAMNLYCDDIALQELRFKSKCAPYRRGIESIDDDKAVEILDSLCDQIVTAIGVGYMLDFDMVGALTEVNSSNWSKFEDGEPIFDENGKIAKGKDYFKPELAKYIKRGAGNAQATK